MKQKPKKDRPPQGVLVGSGTFRVDRKKALEKLSRFQLLDPDDFLLPLVRAATAAGAARIELDRFDGGLRLRFDGRPFSAQELADPYAALLEGEGEALEARRQLGMGLLAALREPSASVDLSSGPRGGRTRLIASSTDSESVGPSPDGSDGTGIHILRPSADGFQRALDRTRQACALCPAQLWIDGSRAVPPPEPDAEPALVRDEGETRWRLEVPSSIGPSSTVELCILGVRVQTLVEDIPGVSAHAWIDDPRLQLDASQASVQRNELLRTLLFALAHRSDDLIPVAGAALRRRLPEAWSALVSEPELRKIWVERLEGAKSAPPPGGSSSGRRVGLLGAFRSLFLKDRETLDARFRPLEWDLRALRWLRDLYGRKVPGDPHRAKKGYRKLLRQVPLFVSCSGFPLSVEELFEMEGKQRRLFYRVGGDPRALPPALDPGQTIWVQSPEEVSSISRDFLLTEAVWG